VTVGIVSFIPGKVTPSRTGFYRVTVESSLVYPTVKIDDILLPDADPLSIKTYSKRIADIELNTIYDWDRAKSLGLEHDSFPNDSQDLYQSYFESHSLTEAKSIALQQEKELQAIIPSAKWDGILYETLNTNGSYEFHIQ